MSLDELLVGDDSFECFNFVYSLERRNHGRCCIDQDQEYIGERRRNDMTSFEQVDKITNLECGCTEMAIFENAREETPGCEYGIDEIASMDQESNEMFDFRRGCDEMNTWENYETTRSELENCGITGIESGNEMVAICESRNCGMTRFDSDNDEATAVDQRIDGQNNNNGGTVRSVDSSLSLLELNCFENIVTRAISIESLDGSLEQTPHNSSDGVPAIFSPTPVSIPLSCHSRSDDANNRSISSRHSHSSESLSGIILDPVLPRRERRHSDPFGTSSSNETSCSNDSRSGRENWYFYDPRLMPSRGRRAAPVWSFFQQLRGQRASIVAPPAYEEITPSYDAIGSSNDPIMTVPSSTNPVEASNMQTSYATDAHLSDDEQAPPPYQETDPQPVAPPIYEAAPPTYDEALQANAVEDLANPSPVIAPDGQSGEDEVGSRQPTDCWYLIPRCSPSSGIFGGQRAMRWNGSSGVDRWASAHSWLRT